MSRAFVVAVLGAESTGKTTLAVELGRTLTARGRKVGVVPEVLREFCEREGRTPRRTSRRRSPPRRPGASPTPRRARRSSSPTPRR
jgi:hypothetical protein